MTLALLWGLNLTRYMTRQGFNGLLPFIADDLSLTDAQLGTLGSALTAAYTLAAPAAGWLACSGPLGRWIGASSLAANVAAGLAAAAGGWWGLLTARTATGAAQAAFSACAPAAIANLEGGTARTLALSRYAAAAPLGAAAGYAAAGWLGEVWGWRWACAALAVPGLALAPAAFAWREPVLERDTRGPRPLADYAALLRVRSFALCVAAMTLMLFAVGAFAVWMPIYMVRWRGVNPAHAAAAFGGLTAAAGIVGSLAGGWLAARAAPRHPGACFLVAGLGLLAGTPLAVASLWIEPPAAAMALLFAAETLVFFNLGPLNAVIAAVVSPARRPMGYAASAFLSHALGDSVSPALVGAISQAADLRHALSWAAAALALSGLVCLAGARAFAGDAAAAGEAA